MRRSLSAAAVVAIALALLLPAGARAQDAADDRLKALIGKKAGAAKKPAKTPPAGQLGSGKDEESEAPPSLFTAAQLATDSDEALLKGILYAYEPAPREIRVIAIGDLALLADPRALNALAHLVLDPDPGIAAAAVQAVGHFQHPRAEEILSNIARHPVLSPALKVAAVNALPFQATETARGLLTEISRSQAYVQPVRQAAQTAVAAMSKPPPAPAAAPGTAPAAATPPGPEAAPPLVPTSQR